MGILDASYIFDRKQSKYKTNSIVKTVEKEMACYIGCVNFYIPYGQRLWKSSEYAQN